MFCATTHYRTTPEHLDDAIDVFKRKAVTFASHQPGFHSLCLLTKRDGTAEGLYVLDAANHGLIQYVPMLRPYSVAVNPSTNHVFVVQADLDEIYVLDADDGYRLIRAIDTDPNNGDIPGMHGGQGIGV